MGQDEALHVCNRRDAPTVAGGHVALAGPLGGKRAVQDSEIRPSA